MQQLIIALAGVNGLLAVAAGAFGSHGLRSRLAADALQVFEIAARYHIYHALALAALGAMAGPVSSRLLHASALCLQGGILIFCGSLYAMALSRMEWKWLGPITPIGGVLLMAGWFFLAWLGLARAAWTPPAQ